MSFRLIAAACATSLIVACSASSAVAAPGGAGGPITLVDSPRQARALVVGKVVEDPRRGLLMRLDAKGRGLVWRRGDASATPVTWTLKSGAQMKKAWMGAGSGMSDTSQFVSMSYPPSAEHPRGRISDLQVDFLRAAADAAPPAAR